ncbi:MAG: hypothetical protein KAW51_00505 [Candidatus Lokiarchaeota archaeon]|nr:hypothetical protein [Candidatus Lokiarchaeota archaeon]
METNKKEYCVDEQIHINASWTLDYNPFNEISYVQVQVFNSSDDKVWNSSEYTEIGSFEKNWSLELQELALDFSNYTNTLYIKFFSFYFHIYTTNTICTFLETIKIKIIKKIPSYELNGFKNNITYGEFLNFTVRFRDSITYFNIINKTIELNVISNSIIIFQNYYITDNNGTIFLNLTSTTHLSIGINLLTFFFESDKIYNHLRFSCEIIVKKIPVFIDVLDFQSFYKTNKNINISLFFYHGLYTPIINESVKVFLYNKSNDKLIYQNIQTITTLGLAQITIPVDILKSNGQNFTIAFIFEGTNILENNSLSLDFNYNEIIIPIAKRKGVDIKIIISIIVGVIWVIITVFLFINRKKIREKLKVKKLVELTVRY